MDYQKFDTLMGKLKNDYKALFTDEIRTSKLYYKLVMESQSVENEKEKVFLEKTKPMVEIVNTDNYTLYNRSTSVDDFIEMVKRNIDEVKLLIDELDW